MRSMKVSAEGIAFLKREEGCILRPYRDVAGVPTIGFGQTHYADGRRVTMDDRALTQEEAETLFRSVLSTYERGVSDALMVNVAQHQFDALVSLAYNIGIPNFHNSTLLRKLNQGDFAKAAAHFADWKMGGRPRREIPVLVARRAREAALFTRNMPPAEGAMPQEVGSTRELSWSTELRNQAITVVTGIGGVLAPFVPFFQDVVRAAPYVIPGVIVVIAVVGIYLAVRRNREGR